MPEPIRFLDGRRILVVEDEYFIATEIKLWLEKAGADVIGPVPDLDQAIDLIEAGSLDAAVLDINLGEGSTIYPAADKLSTIGVPYLFATGDVKVADTSVYSHRPRLEKPYTESRLVWAMFKLIG